MFVLQMIFFFIYLGKKLKPLKYFMLTFNQNNNNKDFNHDKNGHNYINLDNLIKNNKSVNINKKEKKNINKKSKINNKAAPTLKNKNNSKKMIKNINLKLLKKRKINLRKRKEKN